MRIAGKCIIFIPAIILAEMMYICEKKKVDIKFKDVLKKLENSLNYVVYNLDLEVLIYPYPLSRQKTGVFKAGSAHHLFFTTDLFLVGTAR